MDASIAQFTDITGATSEQAQFFLQSANGVLETAMSTYYESGGASATASASSGEPVGATAASEDQDMAEAIAASQANLPSQASQPQAQTLGGASVPASASTSGSAPSSRPPSSAAIRPTPSGNKKKFGTFATLGAKDDDEDSDDEDKKKPQNYFAGGEKSGISVQDPNAGRKKQNDDAGQDAPNDLVRSLLKKAAEGSASREEREQSKPAASSSSSSFFKGSGNTLGSEDTPSQVVPDPEAPAPRPSSSRGSFLPSLPGMYPRGFANLFGGGAPAAPAPQQPEEAEDDRDLPEDYNEESVTRHLTLWRDGFSVEDGELMRYDEPRNMAILKAIQEGTAPEHILNVRFGQQVELRVAQRTNDDYVPPPKKPMKAFGGSGNRLGAPTSATASPSTSSTSQPAGILQGSSKPPPSASSSLTTFEVDGTKPVTTLQIRLGDGTRQTARFNHTHTIADIRSWINAGNPGMASRNYVLMTTFPSKELSEEGMTIEEAKLMGSVVVQKWT